MSYNPVLSHFDIDLKRGQQAELWVVDICEMMAKRSGEIEVKCDFRWEDTGRIYIEMECRGRDGIWRPSGLAVTKAKLWAFKLGNHAGLFCFDTDWLRKAVAMAASHPNNHVECKYGANPTRGVTVHVNHFWKICK
jgi:hypothetical protein